MAGYIKDISKILAIGRNYVDHVKELNNTLPSKPLLFLKPPSSIIHRNGNIEIPKGSIVHHEVELAVIIGKGGRDIKAKQAMDHVKGYTLALDLTARNFQTELAKNGQPWAMAKGFDTFTPLGDFIEKSKIPDPSNVQLWCKVNGKLCQNGNTKDMIFKLPYLLEYISSVMRLEENDILLTGTPSGVGPIIPNTYIEVGMNVSGNEIQSWKHLCVPRPGTGIFGCDTL